MQTISFLLFRLLAFVVKNHLKREKNSKKKIIFSLYHHPLPRIPPGSGSGSAWRFLPGSGSAKKKCGSETLLYHISIYLSDISILIPINISSLCYCYWRRRTRRAFDRPQGVIKQRLLHTKSSGLCVCLRACVCQVVWMCVCYCCVFDASSSSQSRYLTMFYPNS